MRVSVVIPVLNEEDSIAKLLDSLLIQTKSPSEIIVVDGQSEDRTVDIVKEYQKKDKTLKLIVEKSGIGKARNIGVAQAKGDIIAQTDAGCIAKVDWLEKITNPFEREDVDLVAGFYEMPAKTSLQRALVCYLGVVPKRFDRVSFLPSARSVAFKKSLWEEIGGFAEKLSCGEDTLFFYKAAKLRAKIVRNKKAQVSWEDTKYLNLKSAFKKFFSYAKGDSQSAIWWDPAKRFSTHNIKALSVFARYLFVLFLVSLFGSIILPVLFGFYAFWSISKLSDVVFDWKARAWIPVVQITSDLAVMSGFTAGLIKNHFRWGI